MNYSELSNEAKEKAREEIARGNLEDGFWSDFNPETLFGFNPETLFGFNQEEQERIDAAHVAYRLHGFKDTPNTYLMTFKDVYFDVDRTGCISFKRPELDYFTAACVAGVVDPSIMQDDPFITSEFIGREYMKVELDFDWYDNEPTAAQRENLEKIQTAINDKIQKAWKIISEEYEYIQSSEYIEELIEANDYEFDEEGGLI